MESKDKTRVSLLLDRDLVETADKIMKERGYRSRNQFYSALLADAVADEVTDKHKDILGEKFAEAMTEYVEEIKRAVSKRSVSLCGSPRDHLKNDGRALRLQLHGRARYDVGGV